LRRGRALNMYNCAGRDGGREGGLLARREEEGRGGKVGKGMVGTGR